MWVVLDLTGCINVNSATLKSADYDSPKRNQLTTRHWVKDLIYSLNNPSTFSSSIA